MTRHLQFLLFLLLIPATAEAQRERMRPIVPRRGIPLYYEAVTLFTPDTSTVTVNVHFRVPRDFFIYIRNEGANSDSAFIATGEILVELLDNQSVTVSRDLRFLRLYSPRQITESSSEGEVIGLSSFTVPPATYRLAFNVDDKQSGRRFADRSRMINAKALEPNTLNVSDPILVPPGVMSHQAQRATVPALNYGGDIVFGGGGGNVVLQVFSPDSAPDFRVQWTLKNKAPLYGIDSTELSGGDFEVQPGRLIYNQSPDTTLYRIDQGDSGWHVVYLPLHLEKLFEGRCHVRVRLSSGSTSRDVTDEFRIVWPGKPGSLFDLDLAIDALQHIATEEQMDEMRALSLSSRTAAFFTFWRAMDRDTATAFNEMFAEYYRRVDIAMMRFPGPKDVEGYRTDQGRIYVLYGEPSSSRRVFSPDNDPEEIWTYDNLKQRFVFVDKIGRGVFILTEVQQL
jgi:GWxTD domain-containing protein